jgi:hypothetical protein
MKRLLILLLFPFIFATACESVPDPVVSTVGTSGVIAEQIQPEPVPSELVPRELVPTATEAVPEVFDPGSISRETFDAAKRDIQGLVEELNGIIRSGNYEAWITYLDSGYLAYINSYEGLQELNESPRLQSQKIVLGNALDYFTYVVIPSRDHDRIDDIEFVSPTRVKAFTVNVRRQRLRLYELEKTQDGWKILSN